MDKTQLMLALLGSAAVGALVSSIITAVTQHLDRKARRQELLLKEALELAQWRMDLRQQNATNRGTVTFRTKDKIAFAELYYRYLAHLLKHGKLPDDANIDRF